MSQKTVALFATCLVDMFRPPVAVAAEKLLRHAGYDVERPRGLTCCGQPNHNSGDQRGARTLAARTVGLLADYDYIVVPSGSCGATIKVHYPDILSDTPQVETARAVAHRTFELTQFLADVAGFDVPKGTGETIAYHDCCSGLRELGVKQQPRQLLQASGVDIAEMKEPEACCGFGGLFALKFSDISAAIADQKLTDAEKTSAPTLVLGDLGCALHLSGRAHRCGKQMRVRHVAELLAEKLP